jgi:hypothetical protein
MLSHSGAPVVNKILNDYLCTKLPTTENEKSVLFVIHHLTAVRLCVAHIRIMEIIKYAGLWSSQSTAVPAFTSLL